VGRSQNRSWLTEVELPVLVQEQERKQDPFELAEQRAASREQQRSSCRMPEGTMHEVLKRSSGTGVRP
jgi:hypothetical protein